MSSILVLVLSMGLPWSARGGDSPVPVELVGTWRLESMSFKGQVPRPGDSPMWLAIFGDGQFVVKSPEFLYGGTVAVDPSSSPAAIDFHMMPKDGQAEGWTNLGVFEIRDGVLTTAKAPANKQRPESVLPHVDSVVHVFRRD